MRFATVGADIELNEIAESLVESGGFWLAAVGDRSQLATVGPRTESVEQWEDLLRFPSLELVVCAADNEPRDDVLRKLVQADVPLLMIHPVCTAIVAIELEMIRDDVGTRIAAYCPMAEHPAFVRLMAAVKGLNAASAIGEIQQVVMERRLERREDENVLWALRRDCEVLRRLSGRMRHVNAMGEAGKGVGFHNLSVNMTSLDDVVHRWSVAPGDPSVRLQILGERGEAVLELSDDSCQLIVNGEASTFPIADGRDQALTRLLEADPVTPDWTDVRHALEIAEAAERSAVKGKTIELFNESYTEESSFKGLMAIGGCGLLLATFFFAIIWSAVEGVRLPSERNRYDVQRAKSSQSPDARPAEIISTTPLILRLWPAYPFAAFLLLQLLRLVFAKPTDDGDGDSARRRDSERIAASED